MLLALAVRLAVLLPSFGSPLPDPHSTQLPEVPRGYSVSKLAREVVGNARGVVQESRKAANGVEYPTRLKVWHTSLGTLAHDDVVEFTWDAEDPPTQLGSDAEREHDPYPLCLFDARRRLLLVSYEGDERQGWLLSTIGKARVPSTRFTERELDWAWLAYQRKRGYDRLERLVEDALSFEPILYELSGFVAAPGHVELLMRFTPESLSWLAASNDKPDLQREWIRLRAWDPCAEHAALHDLLDRGWKVDATPFLGESTRFCARVAAGEQAAREELLSRLEQLVTFLSWDPRAKPSLEQLHEHKALQRLFANYDTRAALAETAAYGSPAALPCLRVLVRERVGNSMFAWLKLGGSKEELLAVFQGGLERLPSHELVRAATFDAFELLLEKLEAKTKAPSQSPLYEEIRCVDDLVAVLRPKDPVRVLELARPVLRACLESGPANQTMLLITLMHAGDETALDDFEDVRAGASGDVPAIARTLARVPGERVVEILMRLLLRDDAGSEGNCDTGQGERDFASVATVLHQRSAADRAHALRLLDAAPARDQWPCEFACLRWALGELPSVQCLRDMPMSALIVSCRLSLEGEWSRYAELHDELNKEPRKYWLQLALLRDESALPAWGEWLHEQVEARESVYEPLQAIRLMNSSEAAKFLSPLDCSRINSPAKCFETLGMLEDPASLSAVAARCLADQSSNPYSVWSEFLVLLGRRN